MDVILGQKEHVILVKTMFNLDKEQIKFALGNMYFGFLAGQASRDLCAFFNF